MKPKNFPARKLKRQIAAQREVSIRFIFDDDPALLDARAKRTKINRSGKC